MDNKNSTFWESFPVWAFSSLIPGPWPTFHCLQYGKAGERLVPFLTWAWHNRKMKKLLEQTGCVLCTVQPTTCSMLSVYDSRPLLARYVLRWRFFLFWTLCTHSQLNCFYHPFYPDVTCEKSSPCFSILQAMKSWVGPENKARYCFTCKLTQCVDKDNIVT